jgi:hypothetical protein
MTTLRRRLGLVALLGLAVGAFLLLRVERPESPPEPVARTPDAARPLALEPAPPTAPSPEEPPVPVEPEPSSQPATQTKAGYAIEGTVLEMGTERPVTDANVLAWWLEKGPKGYVSLHFRSEDATTDGAGRFRLDLPSAAAVSDFVLGRDWNLWRWTRDEPPSAEKASLLVTQPGVTNRVTLWAQRTFDLRGVVVDPDGRPIPEVEIEHDVVSQAHDGSYRLGTRRARSDIEGRFAVGPFVEDPGAGRSESTRSEEDDFQRVTFRSPEHVLLRIDPLSIPRDERDRARVVLSGGFTWSGVLLGPRGEPLPDVVVAFEYGDDWRRRRAVRTDARGGWSVARLGEGPATLVARAYAFEARLREEVTIRSDEHGLRLVADPIVLSRPLRTEKALGLTLADVDDEVRAAYDLPAYVSVLVVDPGRVDLGIGRLEPGYGLWIVGKTQVKSVREAVERLLDTTEVSEGTRDRQKRVVYTFADESYIGTNTQHVTLTDAQLADLRDSLDRLSR